MKFKFRSKNFFNYKKSTLIVGSFLLISSTVFSRTVAQNNISKKNQTLQVSQVNQKKEKQKTIQQAIPAPNRLRPRILPGKNKNPDEIKISSGFELAYEQNAEPNKDGIRGKGVGFSITPSLTYGDFSILGEYIYAYNAVNPEKSEFSDAVTSVVYNAGSFSAIQFSPYASLELPFSKSSREDREIKYVSNIGFKLSLDSKALDIEQFNLSYSVAYGHYENNFTTSVSGEPSNDHKIVQTIKTSYNIKPFTFSLKFRFISNYSLDNVVRNSFLHVQAVTYSFAEIYYLSIYHYNAGPLLQPTTYENNLKAFDKENSILGLAFGFSI